MFVDIILISWVLIFVAWFNGRLTKKNLLTKSQGSGLQLLWIYHILFSFLFYYYLNKNGGDAIRYWALEADVSQNAESWMAHWGRGTFFIQWLNYIPSKVLGLGFLFGNVVYGVLSFLGIREIYLMAIKYWPENASRWVSKVSICLFFLPNLHFWSSGVSKEALLILGMGLAFKGLADLPKQWVWLVMGVVLSFWVRPIAGFVLGGVVWFYILFQPEFSFKWKMAISLVSLVVGALALERLVIAMHMEEVSIAALLQFSAAQLEFLRGFGAGSEVPMETYSWSQRLGTFFFRPFWNDIRDIWDLAAAIENSIAIVLLVGLISGLLFAWYQKVGISIPKVLYVGLGVLVLMGIVYAMTLNNLGIMMRMKSTYMLFFYLFAVSGLVIFHSAFPSKKI
jgi:hypothetical protein